MKNILLVLLLSIFSASPVASATTQVLADITILSPEESRASAALLLVEDFLVAKGSSSLQIGDVIKVTWADGSGELAEIGCFTGVSCIALVEDSQVPDNSTIPKGPRVEIVYE